MPMKIQVGSLWGRAEGMCKLDELESSIGCQLSRASVEATRIS